MWDAVEARHKKMKLSGELAERHRQQNARWLWKIVDEQLFRAVRNHPSVTAIRNRLERDVLTGTLAPEAAARQILQAFGHCASC